MEDKKTLSRRDFLRISAIGAASAMVVACGSSTTSPTSAGGTAAAGIPAVGATTAPGTAATSAGVIDGTNKQTTVAIQASGNYKDAPSLADLVKSGKLPPVAQRLPKNPYVPPHKWLVEGKYGGNMNFSNSWGGNGVSQIIVESMYGHSPLRWLRDGLEIGPGLVEKWEKNADASQWTFHFREGLKWSDGQPFTMDDILYWWNDLATNTNYTEEFANLPDEARSGKGTLAKFNKVDDHTLQIVFDAPTPLTADRMAMWVNGPIGPRWLAPKHYLQQFDPKYNTSVKDYATHKIKMDTRLNPECPVMTGWKLKEYKEGTASSWERNPYYWCVDKAGNQLPYIDTIRVTGYQDKEVEKVNYLAGKVDFTHHWLVQLTDVQAAKQAQPQSGLEVRFWDDGGGTGQSFFFSYDFAEPNMRKLIREPKFRKALSMAVDRAAIQRDFYFNTGELTTGTMSPKAIEYNVNAQGKQVYAAWRDSAVKLDPEAAKTMLDGIGVKAGADGMRTMPGGAPLSVELVYDASTDKNTIARNERLAANWKAIGINAKLVPVPSTGRDDKWASGQLMSNADWGIGDGPNCLVYPQWLVPLEQTRWAPLEGTFYKVRGTPKENAEKDVDPWKRQPPRLEAEKGGPVEQLWAIYDKTKVEPDAMKRNSLVWDITKIHIDQGPFVQGVVANTADVVLVKQGLTNVPKHDDLALGGFCGPWIHPTPAVYDPETWFWDAPDKHV